MSRQRPSTLDRLRQPEYTGENRCIPCTVVNVVIALVASALVAVASLSVAGSAAGLAVAVVAFALSLAAIYLRGYLVPGTPELTQQFLPGRVLRAFGKDPVAERIDDEVVDDPDEAAGSVAAESDDDTGDEPTFETVEKIRNQRENSVDVEAFLAMEGVIESDPDAEWEYAFTGQFASAARDRLPEDIDGVGPERLAPLFDVDPADVEPQDREYPAYRVSRRIRKWPTPAALALDVATYEALDDWTDRWADVPMEQRLDVVEWLRGFYGACPVCEGPVAFSDGVIESCCGQFDVTSLACTECGRHLREFDPEKVGNREDLKGITP